MQMIKRSRRSSRKSIMQSSELISTGWVVNANSASLEIKFFPPFVSSSTRLKLSTNRPTMESRATQTEIKVTNGKQLTSKDIQTSLDGDEVERLRDFHDKYWEKQLKLDVNLRWNGFCQIDLFFFFILWPSETCLYLTRYGAQTNWGHVRCRVE